MASSQYEPERTAFKGTELGKGHFGEVYVASASTLKGQREETQVAVKCLKGGYATDSLPVKQFASEMETLATIGTHLNIVSLLGVVVKGKRLPAATFYPFRRASAVQVSQFSFWNTANLAPYETSCRKRINSGRP